MNINQYHSYCHGPLSNGCRFCVRGEKLVLFITGLCPRKCYFCPVSDEKFQKDIIFANERKVDSFKDILEEAQAMKAKGAGITGGDPLEFLDRTVEYIKKLKKEFGNHFHIHLYTSLNLVTKENLTQLYHAGLDEIRFHLDLDSKKLWSRIKLAKEFQWALGVEVPLIPNKQKELQEMIDFIPDKVDFINLNELEVADNQQSKLLKLGFEIKDSLSYAIKDSLELGLKLIDYIQKKNYTLPVHLCTAKLKDATQLANRIKREAKYSKKDFDLVNDEGLLTRGALYLEELKPGFGYRNQLKGNLNKYIKKLRSFYDQIKTELKLKDEQIVLDAKKPRILMSSQNIKKNLKLFQKLRLVPAIVTEYPTADQLEIEIEFL